MKKLFTFLILLTILSSCTSDPAPTPTPTAIPTATPIPDPITGTIFWDANGSGLQDEASFIMPEFDADDPPYFFELLAANDTGLGNLSPGELATVPEPPIPGITVCLSDICAKTDAGGAFTLQPEKVQSTYKITFTDPNAYDPARAFRYINKWNGPVVIESYEMNDITVPKQHLNDTVATQISKGMSVDFTQHSNIGFMQGYLTWVFLPTQINKIDKYHGFDLDDRDGIARNYLGETKIVYNEYPASGTGDNHNGIDWGSLDMDAIGLYILSSEFAEVNFVGVLDSWHGYTKQVTLEHRNIKQKTGYGHLENYFVIPEQNIYRGQIVGTLGMSGTTWPHIHYAFHPSWNKITAEVADGDPFRDFSDPSSVSWWTVDNIPQFPLVKIAE